MIEKDLNTALKSVCERTYPVVFPQKVVFPAIVYQVVYDGANQATNGNLTSRDVRFQVDIYSNGYGEAKALKEEVVLKVIELGGGDVSAQDLYENELELHRQLIDFKIKRI